VAVSLLLALLVAQPSEESIDEFLRPPRVDRVSRASGRSGTGFAFFEAFPQSGAGTTTACSTTPPTGARGEALTFTRTGNATCSKKGLATTGIADGDLVVMSGNQPRVEYDSAGTLGLLVEAARTNNALRSEEFDNAAWTKSSATITANAATAPDGTLTADRLQYSNTNNTYVLQSWNVGTLSATSSVYLRGNGVSGTLYMCRGGAASQCTTCSYVSTSWSRCVLAATYASSNNVFFGCETATLGSACAMTGFDVFIWGAQFELGAYATSYIPTTSAPVTRNAETASFALPTTMPLWPSSMAVSVTSSTVASAAGSDILSLAGTSVSGRMEVGSATSALCYYSDGTNTPFDLILGITFGNAKRGWCATSTTGNGVVGAWDGIASSDNIGSPMTTPRTVTGITVGQADGIFSRVCLDPSEARCR